MVKAMLLRYLLLIMFAFSLICGSLEATEAPRLLIKMPTRSRSERFFRALDAYYANLSHAITYHFVISCDIDDRVMNSPDVLERLKSYPNLSIYFGNNTDKIMACNADIEKHLDFDIILLASDDMIPVVFGYDLIISQAFDNYYPNLDGVLHFNDGYTKAALDTLPILGKKYYDHFGYIYYPGYKTSHCDNEMTYVATAMNKLKYFDDVIIEHRHPAWGKATLDELYVQNDRDFWTDKALFDARKVHNFYMKPFE